MLNGYRVTNTHYNVKGDEVKLLVITKSSARAKRLASLKLQEKFPERISIWGEENLEVELVNSELTDSSCEYVSGAICTFNGCTRIKN